MRIAGVLIMTLLIACGDTKDPIFIDFVEEQDPPTSELVLNRFLTGYDLMPEKAITVSLDSSVWAQYVMPTDIYAHGILGDRIEAKQLVVFTNDEIFELILDDEYVFEDVRPRLFDVDGDDNLELVTIRTHVDLGAGIMIYDITDTGITEFGFVPEIGLRNRWLNLVAIDDLDDDGLVEMAWIETPHIGGTLRLAKITTGTITPISEQAQYSNHAIGETNLCLSALTVDSGRKVVFVPTQNRDAIVGFVVNNNELQEVERITFSVDFSQPLVQQYAFDEVIEDIVNCIE